MKRLLHTKQNLMRRKHRIRTTIQGTANRPRLHVHVSHLHVSAQVIDDDKQHTLAYVSTIGQKTLGANLSERAAWVGTEIAKKAKTAKVKQVVLDRNGRLYHGRVKALADAARAGGLEF